ncbi:MAG TPA: hypothetical protein VJ802_11530 [Gemmatimonadaceae bacterium]|mgnify:FL=1|nr:hypothetical protein [Gemmatimonadaceae bacterium]
MELWLGVVTFVAGSVLWRVASRERAIVAPWLPRLGIGIAVLGLGTLAITLEGVFWNFVSIVASLVAIGVIVSVILEILRRR